MGAWSHHMHTGKNGIGFDFQGCESQGRRIIEASVRYPLQASKMDI